MDPSKEECARYLELGIVPVPLPGDKKSYDTILSTVLKQMALYFNPLQEQESLEVVSNLAEIQSHSANELIVSADIKNKTFYKVLFEFIKEASSKISDVLNAIQKAKKHHGGLIPQLSIFH